VGHLVEERLVATDRLGDDPQEPDLDVFDAVVEQVQERGRAGDGRLRQDLLAVPVRVAGAQ